MLVRLRPEAQKNEYILTHLVSKLQHHVAGRGLCISGEIKNKHLK